MNLEAGDVIRYKGVPHRVVRAVRVTRMVESTAYEITPENLEPTNEIVVVQADECQLL